MDPLVDRPLIKYFLVEDRKQESQPSFVNRARRLVRRGILEFAEEMGTNLSTVLGKLVRLSLAGRDQLSAGRDDSCGLGRTQGEKILHNIE